MSERNERLLRAKEADLPSICAEYSGIWKQGKEFVGPCPMCGGDDRFSLYRSDKDGNWRWACRGCNTSGGDAIDLMVHLHRISVPTAISMLIGESVTPKATQKREPVKARAKSDWDHDEWQRQARTNVEISTKTLAKSSVGQNYLIGRCIERSTWERYQLGFSSWQADHIVIPWITADGKITAVKYRKLRPKDHKDRFRQKEGGNQVVFGAQFFEHGRRTLITEGELNCLSAKQVLPDWNCLSAGGEKNYDSWLALLANIDDAMIWVDDIARASHIFDLAGRVVPMIASPVFNDKALDANDILVQFGPEALATLIHSAYDSSAHKIDS